MDISCAGSYALNIAILMTGKRPVVEEALCGCNDNRLSQPLGTNDNGLYLNGRRTDNIRTCIFSPIAIHE